MFPWAIAEQLRLRGHDVVSVKQREDLVEQSDSLIFSVAQVEGRAILTENIEHFMELAVGAISEGRSHAGLIYTTDRTFFRGNPRTVGNLVRALETLLSSDVDISGREVWLRPS